MRNTVWLGVVCVVGAAAINACGSAGGPTSSEGSGDQGTGGNATTSSSSSSGAGGATTSSSSSSSSSTSSSSSSSGAATVNGCDPTMAVDHTADTMVTIDFGGTTGLKYAPACIKIKTGTEVTFAGAFSSHPLSAGEDGTPAASSPIAHTATGTSAAFTFPDVGTFPYYCDFHFSSGMEGAIFVE